MITCVNDADRDFCDPGRLLKIKREGDRWDLWPSACSWLSSNDLLPTGMGILCNFQTHVLWSKQTENEVSPCFVETMKGQLL